MARCFLQFVISHLDTLYPGVPGYPGRNSYSNTKRSTEHEITRITINTGMVLSTGIPNLYCAPVPK
eukprot:3939694-Rhodomonas_salina.1